MCNSLALKTNRVLHWLDPAVAIRTKDEIGFVLMATGVAAAAAVKCSGYYIIIVIFVGEILTIPRLFALPAVKCRQRCLL